MRQEDENLFERQRVIFICGGGFRSIFLGFFSQTRFFWFVFSSTGKNEQKKDQRHWHKIPSFELGYLTLHYNRAVAVGISRKFNPTI